MNDLLSRYRDYLEFRNLSPGTIYRYLSNARDYLVYSDGRFSGEDVVGFMSSYRDMSGTYRRWMMQTLKVFFAFVKQEWPFAKGELPKLSRPTRTYLTFEQVQELMALASLDPLDHALLRIDAVTGARREELSRMLVEDYSSGNRTIRVRTAKGGEERVRRLDPETCRAIEKYLAVRQSNSPYLFVSSYGKPLSPQALSARFSRLAKQLGLKKGTGFHAIRRGVTTWLYKAGMGIKDIQELMGWKSATMPMMYIQLEIGKVEEEATRRHPIFKEGDSR